MVYLDDLELRAIGSVGHGTRIISENDTGPDTCNHAWDGIFVMSGGRAPDLGRIQGAEVPTEVRTSPPPTSGPFSISTTPNSPPDAAHSRIIWR